MIVYEDEADRIIEREISWHRKRLEKTIKNYKGLGWKVDVIIYKKK